MEWKRVAIYGMGEMGKLLKKELQLDGVKVLYAIDRNAENIKTDIPVYQLSNGKSGWSNCYCNNFLH